MIRFLGFIVCIVVLLVGLFLNSELGNGPVKIIQSDEEGLSFEDKSGTKLTFTYAGPLNETVVFFNMPLKFNVKKVNFKGFTALSPSDYQKYLDLTDCKTCPAPFLNRTRKTYIYFSDNPDVIKFLESCKMGDTLNLSGSYLKNTVFLDGTRVDFPFPSKQNFVYINSI